jgi:hypothetical protein
MCCALCHCLRLELSEHTRGVVRPRVPPHAYICDRVEDQYHRFATAVFLLDQDVPLPLHKRFLLVLDANSALTSCFLAHSLCGVPVPIWYEICAARLSRVEEELYLMLHLEE